MSDVTKFKHGEEGTHFACQEMLDKMGGKTGCCGCNNHDCQNDPKPMSNTKPQQDTWKERLKRRFDIPTWMRQRQGIDDNDTFTAEEVQETLECFYDDFIQLSEQQGYQRGYEEGALDATLGKYFEPKELELEKKKWKKLSEKK